MRGGPVDHRDLQAAHVLLFIDFEDAAQHAGQPDAIVTRNTGHYTNATLPNFTSADFLAHLQRMAENRNYCTAKFSGASRGRVFTTTHHKRTIDIDRGPVRERVGLHVPRTSTRVRPLLALNLHVCS